MKSIPVAFFYGLFFLTGISGLVYESVWARYLKLFLGHSSYGQLLTLCIYMGGLAGGSFLSGRLLKKLKNPVRAYGAVEFSVGLMALAFHPIYVGITELYYSSTMLNSFSSGVNEWIKIGLSILMTMPSALLLGMTFPLMAAGLTRWYKDAGERAIPGLYYFNASGAALGILLASFWWVPQFGIDGSLWRAGFLNITIGLLCWFFAKGDIFERSEVQLQTETQKDVSTSMLKVKIWLGFSFFTGFSSFIYEVVWIRMLSLMLGSSSHSFDLMISAFILGLALGAWRVRHQMTSMQYEDDQQKVKVFDELLSHAQLKMGIAALSSLFLWPWFFSIMNHFNLVFQDSAEAYPWWNFFRYALCILWMVPTSYYAGKTLPLLTCRLQAKGHSEKAIGWIYGSNTLGAICGAALAGLYLMPLVGLKGALWLGALTDLVAGWMIWFMFVKAKGIKPYMAVAALLPFIALLAPMNEQILTAGMFRGHKPLSRYENQKVVHGRTATISFHESAVHFYIKTNGKPDASVSKDQSGPIESDQLTQAATALYSAMSFDKPYRAAVVGFGSGMTVHYLLEDPILQQMDMIEIEPAMVELAKGFRPVNENAFSDSRVRFIYDDARTFFHSERNQYDLILSVPSNPWVSGVSSLFTQEFYTHIKPFLSDRGYVVQWIQQYEFRSDILLNILNTMGSVFDCVRYFQVPGESDLLLMAGKTCAEPGWIKGERLKETIAGLGQPDTLFSMGQYLSSNKFLTPFLQTYGVNSDFDPVVDVKAEKARFTKSYAGFFEGFYRGILSLRELDSNEVIKEVRPRIEEGTALASYDANYFKMLLADTALTQNENMEYREKLLSQFRGFLAHSKLNRNEILKDSLFTSTLAKVESWQDPAFFAEVKFRESVLLRDFNKASFWGQSLIEEFYPHTLDKDLLRALAVSFYRAQNREAYEVVVEKGLALDKTIDLEELAYLRFRGR